MHKMMNSYSRASIGLFTRYRQFLGLMVVRVLSMVGLLAGAGGAYAQTQSCAFNISTYPSNYQQTYTVPTAVSIDPRTTIGGTLFSVSSTQIPGFTYATNCPSATGATLAWYLGNVSASANANGVWTLSGSSSIGVRIYRNGTLVTSRSGSTSIVGRGTIDASTYRMEFVKLAQPTGTVTAVSWPAFTYELRFNNTGGSAPGPQTVNVNWYRASGTSSVAPIIRTCTATGTTITLDAVKTSELAQVGSTAKTSATRNITLSCSSSPSVSMRLTTAPVSGTTSVIPVTTGTGRAVGVGVQILYNGNPMPQNTGYSVSNAAGATLNVPVAARYYRTGNLTAGSVTANATIQFTYN